jgi:hypothetical protein
MGLSCCWDCRPPGVKHSRCAGTGGGYEDCTALCQLTSIETPSLAASYSYKLYGRLLVAAAAANLRQSLSFC